jgi:hypothetical protein
MRYFVANRALATMALAVFGFAVNALANGNCSTATLKGAFGFTATGFLVAPSPIVGLFGGIGIQSFDGKGNTEAVSTVSINGTSQTVSIKGAYSVNSDCTGSMTLTFLPSGLVHHFDLVVASSGSDVQGVRTDPGVVGMGSYRRLSGGEGGQ